MTDKELIAAIEFDKKRIDQAERKSFIGWFKENPYRWFFWAWVGYQIGVFIEGL